MTGNFYKNNVLIDTNVHPSNLPKWVQRLLIFFGVLFALFLIVYIAFRTPPVQRYVTNLIGEQLSKQLGTKVSLEGIDVEWFDGVELAGVYVEDQQQDTLLYAGLLAAYIEPMALFNKTAAIRLVEIRETYINLYQPEGQEDLNFAFIPEAFASEDTTTTPEDTTAAAWKIELYQLLLDDIRFDFRADGTEMELALNKLSMLFESLGLDESHIQGDELTIDGLRVALALPPADTTTVVNSLAAPVAAVNPDSSNIINPSGFKYSLNKLLLENSRLAYRVKGSEDSTLQQINFADLVADQLNLTVEDLYVGDTEARLSIPRFTFVEAKSGFRLDELAMSANVAMPAVEAELTALKTGHSALNGNVRVGVTLAESTAELMRSLTVQSRLEGAVLGMADAAYFTNALDSLPAMKELSPELSWQVNIADGDGSVQDLGFFIADQLALRANASFKDLPALDSAVSGSPYFDVQVPELATNLSFLDQFIPPASQQYIPATNDPNLLLTASAEGYLSDLDAKINLQSGVGEMNATAHYAQEGELTNVQTNLKANNFRLSALLRPFVGDTLARDFDQLTFHADATVQQRATARDTTLEQLTANLVVDRLDYKKHRYEGLTATSTLTDGNQLEAQIRYEDSLLNLMTNARADLDKEKYQLNLHLQDANLFRLNLVPDSIIIVNSRLEANIVGTDPDLLTGFVKLSDTEVVKDRSRFVQDSLILIAEGPKENRRLILAADYMYAVITGQFTVAELPKAIEDFEQYYFAATEASGTTATVDTVNTRETSGQRVALRLEVEQVPTLLQAFVPELDIPEPMFVGADFNSVNHQLEFTASVPHLVYGTNVIDSLYLNATTNDRQIDVEFYTDNLQSGSLTIPQIRLEGHLTGETETGQGKPLSTTVADFNLKLGWEDSPYRLDLSAQVGSGPDTITTQLKQLELMLKGQAWETPRNATITYATNYLDIDKFLLKQGDQEIALSTGRDGDKTDLKIMIEQLQLNPLFSALDLEDYQVEGALYGEAEILDMFTPGPVDANFRISQLAVQDTVLGDMVVQVQKGIPVSESEDIIDVLLTLQGKSNDLKVEGAYNLAAGPDEEALDFQVDLTRLTLDDWQPLVQDVLTELSGTLRADMTIKGSTTKPSIKGNFTFADEVFLTPAATGARIYAENQQIRFTGDGMVFDQFTLLDSARTPAVLDGTVTFADLADLRVDLTFETERFIFVSSEKYDNEAFYGRAVASSNLTIRGPVDEVEVAGSLAVEKGTAMTIALVSGPEEAAQAGFLNFVNVSEFAKADTVLQDSLALVSASTTTDSVKLSGFVLSTEVRVDPEARFTVVIDPVNGDRLEVSGEGDLKVDQNLQGDLTMQGTFTINSGSYLLNFAKVIKKEFTVRDGSSITWSGDPANAAIDITAIYTVEEARLEDLVPKTKTKAEGPANVLLTVGGYLQNPELAFDLEVPDVESLGFAVAEAVKSRIEKMDETDIYKNVFGLIVLGRFIPPDGGSASSSGGGTGDAVNDQINNSVSQLLTSQLSKLSEDYLGGVEIDVGLEDNQAGGSGVAGRDIDVALSKELFDDRLTVTVGGTTAAGQNAQGGSSGGFAGEFQVLYRITENGNLNLKAFQSSERNQLTNQIQQNAGVSVLYQSSFDKFFAGEEETLKSRSLEDEKQPQETLPPASRETSERRTQPKKE